MAVTVFFRLLALGTELTLPPVLSLVAKLPLLRVRILRAVLARLTAKLPLPAIRILVAKLPLLRVRVLRAVLTLLAPKLVAVRF